MILDAPLFIESSVKTNRYLFAGFDCMKGGMSPDASYSLRIKKWKRQTAVRWRLLVMENTFVRLYLGTPCWNVGCQFRKKKKKKKVKSKNSSAEANETFWCLFYIWNGIRIVGRRTGEVLCKEREATNHRSVIESIRKASAECQMWRHTHTHAGLLRRDGRRHRLLRRVCVCVCVRVCVCVCARAGARVRAAPLVSATSPVTVGARDCGPSWGERGLTEINGD